MIMTRAVGDRILKDVNGNISDHLRNHIHLTNCIHLKNHMHKHSPILGDRALMRELVVLQRSRSLRDPSASPPSWQFPSVVDVLPKRGKKDDLECPRESPLPPSRAAAIAQLSRHNEENVYGLRDKSVKRQDRHLKTLSDQLKDLNVLAERDDHGNINAEEVGVSSHFSRPKRRRFRGARRSRPSIASRDAEAQNEISVASNSYVNGCGIPWNWSRIHHRGRSFLDLAGRSLSCGLSDSRLRKGDIRADISEQSTSTTKSEAEALPLLLDDSASQGSIQRANWVHNYSGELGIFADNLLNQETNSDLASEGRSREKYKVQKHRNERHQNLTQKYMPRTFRDLIGQNLVVQALSNAIARKKVGFLYLFYGPHGTGKTSCARIFARALNCQSLEHPKPCGYCSSCAGKSRNAREIGPVSKIDFESIIELLDNVIASQLQSQYKVFILDECDTLSSECWSAILKVIDRAPRRVVFVLVCSSLDALPHIIISRCQKFFFPKLKDADIIYTLQWIATKEDLEIDKDALKLIASRSDGSLRDAEMTLEQLSLLGKRISLSLVRELVGLISDEKLIDLLDLALSADTVNTVKNLRDIMESGVEPLALMSQLATVITDILAGSYEFITPSRKFFRHQALSKEDMEKLRQALKTLSEAEKQLRVSNDRMTWLTAALLQLAPDQQYMLPTSSTDTCCNHSPFVLKNNALREMPRKSNSEMPAGSSGNAYFKAKWKGSDIDGSAIQEIWLEVLEKIPVISIKEFMYQEGKLISVSYGAAPTVQLLFNSQAAKSKAEKFRLHILQAFESALKSPVTIEIRCESRKDVGVGSILLPPAQDPTARASNGVNSREIVEIESSPREYKGARQKDATSDQKISALLDEKSQSLSLVRSKVSLGHVIKQDEGSSHHTGWSRKKAVSIAEKLEQENLKLEPRSRRLICWNPPKATHRKLSRLKIRTRKPQALLKLVSCGRCVSGRSPRSR